MKSERRHELEKNELRDWLGQTIGAVKPYQNIILAAVLVLAVGFAAYTWWSRHSGASASEAWNQFYVGLVREDLPKLEEVVEKYPNSRAAPCAAIALGDIHLNNGCEMLFRNKATANDELKRAVQDYSLALERSRDPMLRERATFGLARARESSGELDQARRLYAEVEKNWPKGAYAAQAAGRLSDLKKESTKQWYDRFAKYDPKPAFSEEPGIPGKRPSFNPDESLREDGPVFKVPQSKFGPKPGGETSKEPGDNKPPEGPELPTKPDAGKPDTSKPDEGRSSPETPSTKPVDGPDAPTPPAEPETKKPPAKPDGAEPGASTETSKPAEPSSESSNPGTPASNK